MGSLQDALPAPVSPEVEEAMFDLIIERMASAVSLYVEAVRAAEAFYGPEAREVIRQYQLGKYNRGATMVLTEDNSLRAFCARLEAGCRGTHEWEKLEDTDTRQAYRFTRCAWAEIFRALGAEDIGFWICENDEPAARAFNPLIRMERTKTLMQGDAYCDHVFYIEAL